jgi:hypothetical protein
MQAACRDLVVYPEGSCSELLLTSGRLPLCRYTGMLLWSLSLAGGTQGTDRACSVLYGIAVSTMWFRILEFVLVQQDLGKVLE